MSESLITLLSSFGGVFLAALLSILVNRLSNNKQREAAAKAALELREEAANAAWELLLVNIEAFSTIWTSVVSLAQNRSSELVSSVITIPYEIVIMISQYDSECGKDALKARNYINNYHSIIEYHEAHPSKRNQYFQEILGKDSSFQKLFEKIRASSPKHS